MALFLAACGTGSGDNENKGSNESVAVQDNFKLELISEKTQYKVGEELKITANLTYSGEDEIDIEHGGSWIFLNTTNVTKGYKFTGAMNQPLIITKVKPNEPLIEPYHFSGGTYFKENGGNPYTDNEFEQMASMNFPPGKYRIEGVTEFNIIGEKTRYRLKAEILFEVTKSEASAGTEEIQLLTAEEVEIFERAVNNSKKEAGIVNMADAQYQFILGEESYFLWITEESGTIMNEKDTHSIYRLSNSSVKEMKPFVK